MISVYENMARAHRSEEDTVSSCQRLPCAGVMVSCEVNEGQAMTCSHHVLVTRKMFLLSVMLTEILLELGVRFNYWRFQSVSSTFLYHSFLHDHTQRKTVLKTCI